MTWKTLIHSNLAEETPSPEIGAGFPMSVDRLIDLAKEKSWVDYQQQVTSSEVERAIENTDEIENCTDEELDAWANALVIRMIQQRGQVPNGWNKKSRCARCSTVWSDHGLDTLSCGWCHLRVAGKTFPQPKKEA